eukprot:TRINITY_DN5599_c0_g2_i1.p1 TRINITY_DN5599_c0_g2~~TRINITY_DN5599_c0_g2_i1.p1  ORF type:complete len:469 (-),score=89.32 TRINITY_DN5599_c0_g2_i1:56-1462(-)
MSERSPLLSLNDTSHKQQLTDNAWWHAYLTPPRRKSLGILFWVVSTIVTSVWQGVALKQAGTALPDFPYFIFWFTAAIFVIVFFLFLWFLQYFTNEITPEVTRISQKKLFIVGGLTTLNGVFLLFANAQVSGILQALLGPTIVTIPIAMVTSFFMLRTHYSWKQIGSVVIILGGVVVALLPSLMTPQGGDAGETNSPFWVIMWALGSVPLCISTVYQEKAFADSPVHIAYMLAWSTLWQFVTIIMLAPVAGIPKFGTTTFSNLPRHEVAGVLCFFDVPSFDAGQCPDVCNCHKAWIYVTSFTVAYILQNFANLGLVKYGNATFSFVAATVSMPLTAFAFSLNIIMGDQAEAFAKLNYVALSILLVGVVLYRVFDKDVVASATSNSEPTSSSTHNIPSSSGPSAAPSSSSSSSLSSAVIVGPPSVHNTNTIGDILGTNKELKVTHMPGYTNITQHFYTAEKSHAHARLH